MGRPFNEIGAHLQEYDSQSIGICIIGGLNTRGVVAPDYSAQQQKALYVLIKTLTYMYKDAKVIGHNKLEKTDCPSFDVEEWWSANYQINFKVRGL